MLKCIFESMINTAPPEFHGNNRIILLLIILFPPWLVSLYSYCWPITALRGFCDKRISSNVNIILANTGSYFHCTCIAYQYMKHLESSESTRIKSQNDRPSPEIPYKSCGLRSKFVTLRVAQFVLKFSTFGYFDGAAWTPPLRSPTPSLAPGHTS